MDVREDSSAKESDHIAEGRLGSLWCGSQRVDTAGDHRRVCPQQEAPCLGSGLQRGGHKTAEKDPEAWEGAYKRRRPHWGLTLSGPLIPAPAALWASRGNARAHSDTRRPRTRGPVRQRPPTPRPQPSAAPGPRPASGHIRRPSPAASRAPPQPRVVRPGPAPCHQ